MYLVIPELKASDITRLWKHVFKGKSGECWATDFTHRGGKGYIFRIGQTNYRLLRVLYKLHYGIEPDKHVTQSCHNKACCNPVHSILVDDAELAIVTGRAHNITRDQKERIMSLFAQGYSQNRIAKSMKIDPMFIKKVLREYEVSTDLPDA